MVPDRGILIGQREKLGMTQEEVAEKAGITLKQYQRYEKQESGLSSSSFRIVNAVLSALDLDITAFEKGEYSLEPVPEDDPIYKLMEEYDRRRGSDAK
jgi:transcriptional regulator with XRE-family HTH domain